MTAVRRMTMKLSGIAFGAILSFAVAGSAWAQNAAAPVDVTAAPPPSADTIGPSQLRDFSLGGTVTRPADRPAATAQPQPRATQPEPAAPSPSASSGGAVTTSASRQAPAPSARESSPSAPTGGTNDFRSNPETVTPAPSSVETGSVPAPSFDGGDASQSPALPSGGGIGWSWIAALLALVGGGAFLAWSRRNRRQRYGDPGRMAFAGLVPDAGPEPIPAPPPVRPRPDPVPPRAQPTPPVRPAPQPKPPAADSGLVVSTRLKPQLAVQFQPDRAVITENEVMLQFDLVVANSGSAPARDVLIEACMVSAHAGQDMEIARFFQEPVGKGDRIPVIQPLGKISLKSAVRLPLAQIHSFEMEGRTLFVPLAAFNILYSGDAQASASFLVGRGTDEDEKLAPFRLDLGPRIFRGLSSRPHSGGLTRS